MTAQNDFWLRAIRLAEAYHDAGLTPEERATSVTNQLMDMPPTLRWKLLGDLQLLAANLMDLYPIVAASVHAAEEPRNKRKGGAA